MITNNKEMRHLLTSPFLTTLLLVNTLASSSAFADLQIGLNDVSYMWPPALNSEEAKKLINLDEVISIEKFRDIIKYADEIDQTESLTNVKLFFPEEIREILNWRIVSTRIDSCGTPALAKGEIFEKTKCLQEIRFVAQPFKVDQGSVIFFDYAFHIVFVLDQNDPKESKVFLSLVEELLKLKSNNIKSGIITTGLHLSVHPGFKKDGFAETLKSQFLKYIGKSRLAKVTFSGGDHVSKSWIFFQGGWNNGQFVGLPDPTLNHLSAFFITPKEIGNGGELYPNPSNFGWSAKYTPEDKAPSIIDFFVSGYLDVKKKALLSSVENNLIYSEVFKVEDIIPAVENPQISHRNNTDCFSCHASTSRFLLNGVELSSNHFLYSNQNKNIVLDAKYLNKSKTNFRVFGWFGSKPSIARRVINESAEVVNQLEDIFSKK